MLDLQRTTRHLHDLFNRTCGLRCYQVLHLTFHYLQTPAAKVGRLLVADRTSTRTRSGSTKHDKDLSCKPNVGIDPSSSRCIRLFINKVVARKHLPKYSLSFARRRTRFELAARYVNSRQRASELIDSLVLACEQSKLSAVLHLADRQSQSSMA